MEHRHPTMALTHTENSNLMGVSMRKMVAESVDKDKKQIVGSYEHQTELLTENSMKNTRKLHTSSSIQNEEELQDNLPPLFPEISDPGRYEQSPELLNRKLIKQNSKSGKKITTQSVLESEDGRPRPLYVTLKKHTESVSVGEESISEYQDYIARRSFVFQKKGEQSWMFQPDAEEHYFGSIVELPATKIRDSTIGSMLQKHSKGGLYTNVP